MKFNYKKIATVIGSVLMVGSTIGMAAATTYPTPFVNSGVGEYAVIYGASANTLDLGATTKIAENLKSKVTSNVATPISLTGDGDNYLLQKSYQKLHLGLTLGNVTQSTIDDDNLPTLLKAGVYTDDDNEEYDYEQKIVLNNDIRLKMFSDSDYKKDTPTIGMVLSNNENILNYTLEFTDKPEFTKLETTNIPIMDKMYYVLDVNSANDTITLLDSASDAIISEQETKTLTVGGKTYEVTITTLSGSASSPKVKLTINGETLPELSEAQTRKLGNGAYVGIKDISMRDVAGTTATVEFSIGSGKLIIENGVKVKMNDEDVKNVYGFITADAGKLSSLALKWHANDDTFITPTSEITMPGFNAIKLSTTGMTFPTSETIKIEAGGNDYAVLSNFPLKNGQVDIPIIGKASGNTDFTFIGSDTDELVVTSATSSLVFDASNSNNDYFIASWSDGNDAESYLIRPTGFNHPTTGDDTVDIEYNDGSGWSKKYDNVKLNKEISFGNLDLTISALNSTVDVESVTFTGADASFNTLYTKEGLKVTMPWTNRTMHALSVSNYASCILPTGMINQLVSNGTTNKTCSSNTFNLVFQEENKDGDKAAGDVFGVTIGNNGPSNYYTSVTTFTAANSSGREKSATDVYETMVYSALATKAVEDDSGDQDSVTLTYNGGESFGSVYLTSQTIGSIPATGVMTFKDNEVSSFSGKNLIVIGGSCINTVAAKMLGSDTPVCGAAFTALTQVGAGQFIIKVTDNPYTAGKIAMLVAGYEADDTAKAATYVTTGAINTTLGSSKIGQTAVDLA